MNLDLLKRYVEGRCTREEREYANHWLSSLENQEEAERLMQYLWEEQVETHHSISSGRVHSLKARKRWAVAASVIGLLCCGMAAWMLFWAQSSPSSFVHDTQLTQVEIPIVLNKDKVVEGVTELDRGQANLDFGRPRPSSEVEPRRNEAPRGLSTPKTSATPLSSPEDSDSARKAVKSLPLTEASLVNEQKFLDLLANIDSTRLKHYFTYRNGRMHEILRDIQKKYNLEITVCDERINRMIVNKEFDEVNLRELLFQIRKEMDLTYSVHNNRILICFNKDK